MEAEEAAFAGGNVAIGTGDGGGDHAIFSLGTGRLDIGQRGEIGGGR